MFTQKGDYRFGTLFAKNAVKSIRTRVHLDALVSILYGLLADVAFVDEHDGSISQKTNERKQYCPDELAGAVRLTFNFPLATLNYSSSPSLLPCHPALRDRLSLLSVPLRLQLRS